MRLTFADEVLFEIAYHQDQQDQSHAHALVNP